MKNNSYPDWVMNIFNAVVESWTYGLECDHINFKAQLNKQTKQWEIWCAPIMRELYAGQHDGKKFWSPFVFNNQKFNKRPNILIEESFMTSSKSINPDSPPQLVLQGKYKKRKTVHDFRLHVLMEPEISSKSIEILNTIDNKISTYKEEVS